MGLATWYFLRRRPGEVEPLTRKAFEAFFFDGRKLPVSDDGYVRHVQVIVELDERRAVEVLDVGFFQYRALKDGTIDQDSRMELMRNAGMVIGGRLAVEETPPGVIQADHRFAKRRLEHLQNWEPTDADLAVLRELVNRRAKARLM